MSQLDRAFADLKALPDAQRAAVEAAVENLAEEITSLRTLIVELRPAALDEYGAAAAIESLAARTAARQGLDVDVHLDLAWERGDQSTRHMPELESTLYRLVQESLTNAVRHAGASRVQIDVTEADGSLDVVVTDDGRGFDAGRRARREQEGHLGLTLLEDLVAQAGGSLRVTSSPEAGTTVEMEAPAA